MSAYHLQPAARRRGTVYLVTLSTAMIVMVMGASGLLAVRIHHRSAQLDADLLLARSHARAAAEIALWQIEHTTDWPSHTQQQRTRTLPGDGEILWEYQPWDSAQPLVEAGCEPVRV